MSKKIVHLGYITEDTHYMKNHQKHIFCKIEYSDKGVLSISGVINPHGGGNADSCGQINMSFKECDSRGYLQITDIIPAWGWSHELIKKFFDVWERWHLNDMRAACEHQRAMGWTYETHHGVYETKEKKDKYVIDEYATGEIEMIEVFNPYKGESCPVCGYSIGSAWLFESVPAEVIEFLNSLPFTDMTPAWV